MMAMIDPDLERHLYGEAPANDGPVSAAVPQDAWTSRLVSVDSTWLTNAPPPREYLLTDSRTGRGAMPARGAGLLVAAGGAGKSYTSIALVTSVVTGEPWMGVMLPTRIGRSLIVSAEEPKDEIRTRVYHDARARGIRSIPDGAIDVIDIHDMHMPLLTSDAQPTEHAHALVDLVRRRGPYALTIVDPLARISGASIDGDNVAACALVGVLEQISSAAQGLVLGVHHTSQTARRAGITDATAVRGATGLSDSARIVLVLSVETIDHGDPDLDARLGEIVTIARAKANHVGRWEPIRSRRGEHGVLVPLDGHDETILASQRSNADRSGTRQTVRDDRARARATSLQDAVLDAVRTSPGITATAISAAVRLRLGAADDRAVRGALDLAIETGLVRRDGVRHTGYRHHLAGGDQ